MITISLKQIAAEDPCASGWATILQARGYITTEQCEEFIEDGEVPEQYTEESDDVQFPLAMALESNGFDDTLWALRCLPEYHWLWRKFAVWCARQVQHLMTDTRSTSALDIAWAYSEGMATDADLSAAGAAARDAARAAARDAAGDAAWDAARDAAWDAAWAAARDSARDAQSAKLKQILDAGEWVEADPK